MFVSSQIAEKVAAPLARTNEIVILSGDGGRVTGEVNRLLAELPVSVNALTGIDLSKVSEVYYAESEGLEISCWTYRCCPTETSDVQICFL